MRLVFITTLEKIFSRFVSVSPDGGACPLEEDNWKLDAQWNAVWNMHHSICDAIIYYKIRFNEMAIAF